MIGSLLLELEDTQSVAYWYGLRLLLENVVESEQEVIKRLEAINLEQLNQVANDLFKAEELRLALIGPYQPDEIKWK